MPSFSFALYGTPSTDLAALARRGEECGFAGAWIGDHVVAPAHIRSRYPYAPAGRHANPLEETRLNDVWVAIGAMAASTTTLQLATGVYILPQRNPFLTALAAATAQSVSGGRFVLGVGTGWMREEFELLGHDFDSRGARMTEIVEVLRRLWSGESVSYAGNWYEFEHVRVAAADPPVPIVFGGATARALERAARLGDGWYAPHLTLDELVERREELERLRSHHGRADDPFVYYVPLVGDISADNALRYAEQGFERLTIPTNWIWRDLANLDERLAVLDRLHDELIVPSLV